MPEVPLPPELPRWREIKRTLRQLSQTEDLDEIFRLLVQLHQFKYNKDHSPDLSETPFEELKVFFQTLGSQKEEETFTTITIQTIAVIAGEIESLIPAGGIKFCPSQKLRVNRFNRKLIASLLANAFLSLFPDSEDCTNTINFDWFFESLLERKSQQGKLRCILHYFERLSQEWEQLQGSMVTFCRVAIPPENLLTWQGLLQSKRRVCPMKFLTKGNVDDASSTYLKVVSSEREIGGGVLHSGCLQEEIIFSIYPELLVSKLFMGEMTANEAIVATGFSRYSHYAGYGATFKFAGDFNDKSNKDRMGHAENAIVAIDALSFKGHQERHRQFSDKETLREVNKAFAGFLQPDTDQGESGRRYTDYETWSAEVSRRLTENPGLYVRPIATSHWGCGAFGGDPQLKWALQWLAASQAGCPEVLYFTQMEESLDGVQYIASEAGKRQWRVGQLARCVQQYCGRVSKGKDNPTTLITYMRSYLKTAAGKRQTESKCVLL